MCLMIEFSRSLRLPHAHSDTSAHSPINSTMSVSVRAIHRALSTWHDRFDTCVYRRVRCIFLSSSFFQLCICSRFHYLFIFTSCVCLTLKPTCTIHNRCIWIVVFVAFIFSFKNNLIEIYSLHFLNSVAYLLKNVWERKNSFIYSIYSIRLIKLF